MKIESYTLEENPFNYVISFPFPDEERAFLVEVLESIELNTPGSVLDGLETEMAHKLRDAGYGFVGDDPEGCQLWTPEYRNEVDFYHPEKKIAVEVEKAEVKRVIHDVLKLVNGSMTFIPKVKYGVLVIPVTYTTRGGNSHPFLARVKRELPFYFQKIIPDNCNLLDILLLAYDY